MLAILGGVPVVPQGSIAPWPHVSEQDETAVMVALRDSSPWRRPFPAVQALERDWAAYTGMKYSVATNSGTAALHMAVVASGVKPGDEVIVPADTFISSASCVLQAGAIPVFVDVNPLTYNLEPELIAERVTDRTKAVIAVDLNGLPADYDAIRQIADRYGLAVIEDGAQAHGATYRSQPVGGLGDFASCSMNGCKPLSALGEGGLFTTNDESAFNRACELYLFGQQVRNGAPVRLEADSLGSNYRIDVLAAAFAGSQLARLDDMSAVRMQNGGHLSNLLADIPGITTPHVPDDCTHVYFFFPLLFDLATLDAPGDDANFLRILKDALKAEGVAVEQWQTKPLPSMKLFSEKRGYPWDRGRQGVLGSSDDYPVASHLAAHRLVLGRSLTSFGPPNNMRTMEAVSAAFHKVLVEERDAFSNHLQSELRLAGRQ